jgi:hypothetical protein
MKFYVLVIVTGIVGLYFALQLRENNSYGSENDVIL